MYPFRDIYARDRAALLAALGESDDGDQDAGGTSATVINGVVDGAGVLGSQSSNGEGWALTFCLQPWRVLDGPLQLGRLRMRWRMIPDEATSIGWRLGSYSVHSLRVGSLDASAGVEVVGFHRLIHPDLELARWSIRLQEHFSLDRRAWSVERARARHRPPLVEEARRAALAMNHLAIGQLWSWPGGQRAASDPMGLRPDDESPFQLEW
jgi:hypothetical protein